LILASLRAEWFKIVRRPAAWVTVGLFLLFEVGVGYGVTYLVATHSPGQSGQTLATLRSSLYPASFVPKALANAGTLDGLFALILGVLVQGSEYGWATVKTSQTQLPGRLSILAGRLLALGLVMGVMAATLFALDAMGSALVAGIDGKSAVFPAAAAIAEGLGADWLIFAFMATLGFALATAFRQSAMAIGLGLGYVLLLETVVFALLGSLGDAVKQIHTWFPIANAGYLNQSFGEVTGLVGLTISSRGAPDASHAVVALGLWILGLTVLCGSLIFVRDVQ
jgi:ABC-2 type transport system permease protein